MNKKLTFDDVLIEPQFSTINSRSEVVLTSGIGSLYLNLPIISANMDTITGPEMAQAMYEVGAAGCLHRFNEIDQTVDAFRQCPKETIVSFGLGDKEKDRCSNLWSAGAKYFCLDVAHGAQKQVVEQVNWFKKRYPECTLIVGNFASSQSVTDFYKELERPEFKPDAIKVGIGPGSACTTRIKTGCGVPQLSAIMDIVRVAKLRGMQVIADGGMRTSGDIAKALAAGADAVMLGGMLAGTDESAGWEPATYVQDVNKQYPPELLKPAKATYRGSASKESYDAQGKDWSCAEGESFTVEYKGPVEDILRDIEGGLKSAFTYVGARSLIEFQSLAKFNEVTNNTIQENEPHGKN